MRPGAPAGQPVPEVDLGRRFFFRQFAAEVIHSAATAAGAAGRPPARRVGCCRSDPQPGERVRRQRRRRPTVNPMLAATRLFEPTPALVEPGAGRVARLPDGVPDGPRPDPVHRPAQAARRARRVLLRRRPRGGDRDPRDGRPRRSGPRPGGGLRPGADRPAFPRSRELRAARPDPRRRDGAPGEPSDGGEHRLGARPDAGPDRAPRRPRRQRRRRRRRPAGRGRRDLRRGDPRSRRRWPTSASPCCPRRRAASCAC